MIVSLGPVRQAGQAAAVTWRDVTVHDGHGGKSVRLGSVVPEGDRLHRGVGVCRHQTQIAHRDPQVAAELLMQHAKTCSRNPAAVLALTAGRARSAPSLAGSAGQ